MPQMNRLSNYKTIIGGSNGTTRIIYVSTDIWTETKQAA